MRYGLGMGYAALGVWFVFVRCRVQSALALQGTGLTSSSRVIMDGRAYLVE